MKRNNPKAGSRSSSQVRDLGTNWAKLILLEKKQAYMGEKNDMYFDEVSSSVSSHHAVENTEMGGPQQPN